jgi:hypothetical protein
MQIIFNMVTIRVFHHSYRRSRRRGDTAASSSIFTTHIQCRCYRTLLQSNNKIAPVPYSAITPFDRRPIQSVCAAPLDKAFLRFYYRILLAVVLIWIDPGFLFERDLYSCARHWTSCARHWTLYAYRFIFYHERYRFRFRFNIGFE